MYKADAYVLSARINRPLLESKKSRKNAKKSLTKTREYATIKGKKEKEMRNEVDEFDEIIRTNSQKLDSIRDWMFENLVSLARWWIAAPESYYTKPKKPTNDQKLRALKRYLREMMEQIEIYENQ